MTAIELKISGQKVKAPKVGGLTFKEEKVWSSNTGRTASGKMVGTIKCVKRTVSIEWEALTQQEKDQIERLISDPEEPFTTLEWKDPLGVVTQMACYFGTPSFDGYSKIGTGWRFASGKVDAIER